MSKTGRRGGPPDLKGTLGTLLRTTINQVGAVTDVARRSAFTGKQRLDSALLERRRREALADLGEVLYRLVQEGELALEDLPELTQGVHDVEELERRIAEAEAEAAGGGRLPRPVSRSRGGGGGGGGAARRGGQGADDLRVWRPPADWDEVPGENEGEPEAEADEPAAGAAAGTAAGAGAGAGTAAAATTGTAAEDATAAAAAAGAAIAAARRSGGRPADAGGGIVFLDEEPESAEDDLESYMHEDDVPRRPGTDPGPDET